MHNICEKYGIEINRASFISCPQHSEKTPSMKIYKDTGRGYYCFGCNSGGSVIDFVMQLFQIDFRAAVVRINCDFGLGLSEEKPDARQLDEYRKRKRAEEIELNRYRAEYWAKCYEHRRLWQAKRDYAPQTQDEPLQAIFIEAIHTLAGLDYYFEMNRYK